MKYFENALHLRNIPHDDIYRVHQTLDFHIQETCKVKLPYSFKVVPGSADDSNVLVRSPVSLGLPGERTTERSLSVGDSISFVTTMTMIQRVVTNERKREITPPPEEHESYVRGRFARAGFELTDLLVAEPEYFYVRKSQKGKPIVLPASVILATGIVTSVEDAEKTLVYGVGRKRVFGFGLMSITGGSR